MEFLGSPYTTLLMRLSRTRSGETYISDHQHVRKLEIFPHLAYKINSKFPISCEVLYSIVFRKCGQFYKAKYILYKSI